MNVANVSTATPAAEQGQTSASGYSDGQDPYFTKYIQILYITIVFSCLCGLVGNAKVIWLLSFCIKRKPFTTYILNLAVADFGALLSVLAYFVNIAVFYLSITISTEIWWVLADVLVFFMHSAGLYLLTIISLERAISVLFPVWYQCRRPERSSAVVSFLLWSLSGLLSGILLLSYFRNSGLRMSVNIISTVNFLICTPLMLASSLIVPIVVSRNSQRRQPHKLYVVILITILSFIIFGIPLSVSHILFFNTMDFPLEALEASYLLASVHSSVNPFIYYLVGRDRKHQSRESLKAVFQRLFKDETDPGEDD